MLWVESYLSVGPCVVGGVLLLTRTLFVGSPACERMYTRFTSILVGM